MLNLSLSFLNYGLFLRTIQVFLILLFCLAGRVRAQQELDVIRNKWMKYSDPSHALHHHLTGEAFDLLKKEGLVVDQVKTVKDWAVRQKQIKAKMWAVLGPFATKTPLNPVVTGVVQKQGYRVENIIYESLPGYYVPASLFIPDHLVKPAPAILFCSGHSAQAYRRDLYQLPLLNLVKKGFIVLAFDPVAQGERMQYYDAKTGTSSVGPSTKEHAYPAPQAFLLGQSVARYFVWDGIRAIDYLVSRPEVDAKRIGAHGLSGGGTQSSYIAALDDRVVAVAPAGYITGYKRLLESIGVQDGEQNFYHGLVNGIDHADLLEVRAPKPALIMATTRDFFNIEGTREAFERVKRTYRQLGKPDNIGMVEGDYEHGYTQNIREGMYGFFQKHLQLPGSSQEEAVEYLTEKELQKTTTGQLASSLGGETMFSLNKSEAMKFDTQLQNSRKNAAVHLPKVVQQAKLLSGFRAPSEKDTPVFTGRLQREGYVIERYFVRGEGDYPIPYLLFKPEVPSGKAMLYLHPDGKAAEATVGGEIEWFVKRGFTVMAPDLIGTGEMAPDKSKGDAIIEGVSYNLMFTATLIGRSITGIQAADIIKIRRILKKQISAKEVFALSHLELSPALLHAAAFENTFKSIAFVKPYVSYRSVVMEQLYKSSFTISLVPGSAGVYDLPDLAAVLAPTPLLLIHPVRANGKSVSTQELESEIAFVQAAYDLKMAKDKLFLFSEAENRETIYAGWMD